MYAVLLTVEVIVCVAMIGVILLQRSEGGGLGLGSGGGGVGGMMSGRGAANLLTRTTVILATIFICTSVALALLAKSSKQSNPLGEVSPASAPLGTLPDLAPSAPATPTPDLPAGAPATPAPASAAGDTTAPAAEAPAAPVAAEPSTPANPQPAAPAPATPAGGGTN